MKLPPGDPREDPEFNDRLQQALNRMESGSASASDMTILRRFYRGALKHSKRTKHEQDKDAERAEQLLRDQIQRFKEAETLSLLRDYHL